MADPARVRQILKAPNVEVIKRRKDRAIVQINLVAFGDDSKRKARRGNPFAYSYDGESEENPQNCWALKHLPDSTADIFRASVLDNLKQAA